MKSLLLVIGFLVIKNCCIGQLFLSEFYSGIQTAWEYDDVAIVWDMPGAVQLPLNDGLTALKEGKLRAAVLGFNEAIKIDSTLWVAHYYLGITQKLQGNFTEARASLLTTSKIKSTISEPLVELGKVALLENKIYLAEDYLEKARKLSGKPKISLMLGDLQVQHGNTSKAEKFYKESLKLDSSFLTAKVRLGIIKMIEKKKPEAGLPYFTEVIKSDSINRDALFLRALINSKTDESKSLADLNILIEHNPINFMFRIYRGTLLAKQGDFENSFVDFRRVLKANQEDERNFRGFQSQLDRKLDLQFALNYSDQNMFSLPDEDIFKVKKAISLFFISDFEGGIQSLLDVQNLDQNALSLFLIGIGYEHSGQHENAWQYYKAATKIDFEILDAHKKSGIYYGNKNDWKSAEKEFSYAIEINPLLNVLYKLRGVSRFHIKDYKGAVADFTNFLETDSTDNEALASRAFSYERLGEDSKAADDRVRMTNFTTISYFQIHDAIVRLLEKGDTLNALKYLDRFTENTKSTAAYVAKLDILIKQQNWDRVSHELEVILSHIETQNYYLPDKQLSFMFWVKGLVFEQDGNLQLALEYHTKAIETDKGNSWAYLARGRLFSQTGKVQQARKDLIKASKLGQKDAEQLLKVLEKL